MPYIKQEDREGLDKLLEPLLHDIAEYGDVVTAGQLNYIISRILIAFIGAPDERSYSGINAAIGALECAKLELYRRLVVPYEEGKIAKNGDLPYNVPSGGGTP